MKDFVWCPRVPSWEFACASRRPLEAQDTAREYLARKAQERREAAAGSARMKIWVITVFAVVAVLGIYVWGLLALQARTDEESAREAYYAENGEYPGPQTLEGLLPWGD